ncbi:MAG TPA: peptide ligase PGM1-related protein [Actinomycetes bacterium]
MSTIAAPSVPFDALQRRFTSQYQDRDPLDLDDGTVVVVPSLTFPVAELRKIVAIQHYEERLLYLLLLLRRPGVRVVYLSSLPIDRAIVDYYLGFLPDPAGARERLHMLAVEDPEPRALTAKVLERPDLIVRIRELAGDPDGAFLLPFNVTPLEGRLAEWLRLPFYGPSPALAPLGSKTGSRRVARRAGVPVLDGAEDLWTVAEVERAIRRLRERSPGLEGAVVKLNNGFSGQGNAVVHLDELTARLEDSRTTFCAEQESWVTFGSKVRESGAVVEELLRAPGLMSPSVQLRITPGGKPKIVSTHDQVLGGPNDQVYLGCRFPANPRYRASIQAAAMRAAEVLASHRVIGSFGVDFFVVPSGDGLGIFLAEINLRVGGTTHPLGMVSLASGAVYDPSSGQLQIDGQAKFYVSTDNLKSHQLAGMTPARVIELLDRRGLSFDRGRMTGTTLHLLGALREYGKMGVTCVGDSPEEAEERYREVCATVAPA